MFFTVYSTRQEHLYKVTYLFIIIIIILVLLLLHIIIRLCCYYYYYNPSVHSATVTARHRELNERD